MTETPKAPTEMQINKAASLLRMGLKDYKSMREEAETLAKKLISDRKDGRVDVNATSDKLQKLVASLRASEADIQHQLTILQQSSVNSKQLRASDFKVSQESLGEIKEILSKMDDKNSEEEKLINELESAEGQTMSSSLNTQFQYTKLIFLIIWSAILIAITVIVYLKPTIYWLPQIKIGIFLVLVVSTIWLLVKYLFQ
jgi:hypothetical protein